MGVTGADALLGIVKQKQDLQGYRERHWTGTLEDYMEIVMASPKVARNAYQRLYDMVLSHGVTEYTRQHERYTHYRLFDDPIDGGRDAVEFMLLGAGNVQVCTAVMHYGYRIVEDMIDGLNNYLDEKGFKSVNDIVGKSVSRITDWGNLDLNYDVKAHVNKEHCIRCNLCYVACEDGAHQSFTFEEVDGKKYPLVIEKECVGCNLCALVCPSPGAITMKRVDAGGPTQSWRERTAGN